MGFCYYKTGEYEKAIPYFQKACTADDELSQNAYYHLADCYLHTNAKRSARTAYQSAAKSAFDTEIQEESQFNFAKLSYELNYQSVAIEAFRTFATNFPKSAHLDEANEMLVGIYTSTRNYKDALTSIEAIKNKTQPIRAAYQKVAYYRGIEFFMDNNLKDAIRLLKLSLSNPVDQGLVAEALYWSGEAYYKSNEFENAAKAYNDYLFTPAAVNQEQYNLANYNIGYSKFKLEDYAAAQTAFRKYVKDKSQTDNTRYTDALLRIADCFFMLKDQTNAIEYYNQAITGNAKASDYGIYQKGVILGVQGRMAEKVETLQKLFDKYPKSVYYDDALFEAAQASLIIGNNAQALEYYQQIITTYPNGSYMKKAELGQALVYYNNKEDDKALAAYKKVVQKYPNTTESHEALDQIRKISVNQNKVDEYLAYAQNVPNADVSKAAQDSLMYEAAELRYTQGNCDDAVKDFDSYLKRFPNAIFLVNASYYKSDCLYRNKQYEKANHYLLLYKKNFIHILKKRSSIQNAQLTLLNETKQKMTAYQNNKNEQELKVENTINQRIFAAIMSIILSILAGIMYFIFKKKRSFSIALIGQQNELNQLNLNLQNSILKLEKSNFDLKHFSKIIAHDLNQPLLTIIGYSSIMLKNLKSNSKPSGIEEITRIHKYSTDMSNHITKLLQDSFPQIEREELKEKFKSIH